MNTYDHEKYIATKDNVKDVLNQFGVAIIPNILNKQECKSMVGEVWDFFEHITQNWKIPIDRNNPDSWKEIYKLYPLHSMLIQFWGIGH